MKSTAWLLLSFLVFSNCTTFRYKDSKEKSFLTPTDKAKRYKGSFDIHPFDLAHFGKDIRQDSLRPYAEYFTPQALESLKSKNPKTLVLLWNPGCPASRKLFQFALRLDSLHIPVALVSMNYLLPSITKNIKKTRFENRVIYLLAPKNEPSNKVLLKIRTFAREVCEQCYDERKDELIFTKGFLVSADSTELIFRINMPEIEKRMQ